MGEERPARYGLLQQLASLDPHPESVPVNMLVRVEGTPLGDRPAEDPLELVRTIATARILMPRVVRAPERRPPVALTDEAQALCFLAGANSVFLGEQLLTTPNPIRRCRSTALRGSGAAAAGGAPLTDAASCRSSRASAIACAPFATGSCCGRSARRRHRSLLERLPWPGRSSAAASAHDRRPSSATAAAAPGRGCCAASARLRGCRATFAAFKGTERALYFSSGYLANLAS